MSRSYEVGIGNVGVNWFIGVRPPLDDETIVKLGEEALEDWKVYEGGLKRGSTVFRKWAGELDTVNAAENLIAELESVEGTTVVRDFSVVGMHNMYAPFPGSEIY